MLTYFPKSAHLDAAKKFFVLWVLSVLPILFSALPLTPNPSAQPSATFFDRLMSTFYATDQFIYAVSFLAPMLYLLWEKYREQKAYIQSNKRSPGHLADELPGFGLVLFVTLLMLLFTAFAYGTAKKTTMPIVDVDLEAFLSWSAKAVYFYGLFCWYFVILESMSRDTGNFVESNREREEKMKSAFKSRVRGAGGSQDD